MEKIIWTIFVIVLLFGCQQQYDQDWMKFVQALEQNEKMVFSEGEIPIDLLEAKEKAFTINHYRKKLDSLSAFPIKRLNEINQPVFKTIRTFLQNKIKNNSSDWISILDYLKNDVAEESTTNEEQFEAIRKHLNEIPSYFEQVKKEIKNPDPQRLKSIIEIVSNDYFYLKDELPTLIRKPDILKEDQIDFSKKNDVAQLAIKDFLAYLVSWEIELRNKKS